MRYGYARVSTDDQRLDLQVDALKKAGCEVIYSEHASGTRDDRPELTNLLSRLQNGDVLVIWKLDRLARSTKHLLTISDDFKRRGVDLVSLRDQVDTTTPTGRFFFTVLAAEAELERDLISDRTKAGLATARAHGRILGAPERCAEQVDTAKRLHESGMTVTDACERAGISRQTYYRWLRRKQEG